jgi:hypothetical protein
MEMAKIGEWAFLACIVIAIIAGLVVNPVTSVDTAKSVYLVLVVLGVIVGLLNVSEKETTTFLIAAIALLVTVNVAQWTTLPYTIGDYIQAILGYIGVFVAPAAVIVALKTVWAMGKKK